MLNVVYHPKYLNYSLGENHPFWPERAKKFLNLLENKEFSYKLVEPHKVDDSYILLAHSEDYLKKVKGLADSGGGYLSVDTKVTPENLEAAYYYVGGTIRAAKIGLEGDTVVNTLGGLHHAERNYSSGFCIFNDHAIAIKDLQRSGEIETAAVLDLDVHAGNGTQDIFYSDPSVLKISIHQDPSRFYPGTGFPDQTGEGEGEGYNKNVILEPGTTEEDYLRRLDSVLPDIEKYDPDLLFVVWGVDTYKEDPLASIKLEKGSYGKIADRLDNFDEKVVLFAGGYSKKVPELWFEIVSNLF